MKYQVNHVETCRYQNSQISAFTQLQLISSIITRNNPNHNALVQYNSKNEFACSNKNNSNPLKSALRSIKNKTNRICLQIAWKKIGFFRQNHNLLLSRHPTFIRKSVDPKGLIAHVHFEKAKNVLWGFLLLENSETQHIKLIQVDLNKVP